MRRRLSGKCGGDHGSCDEGLDPGHVGVFLNFWEIAIPSSVADGCLGCCCKPSSCFRIGMQWVTSSALGGAVLAPDTQEDVHANQLVALGKLRDVANGNPILRHIQKPIFILYIEVMVMIALGIEVRG